MLIKKFMLLLLWLLPTISFAANYHGYSSHSVSLHQIAMGKDSDLEQEDKQELKSGMNSLEELVLSGMRDDF